MTIQEQADAILTKAHQRMTPDQLDELFLKLAQDREALLKACKEFVRKCDCGEARSIRSYAEMTAAIQQAERK